MYIILLTINMPLLLLFILSGAKLSLNSTSVNVSEVDSSETSVIPVCVNLVDDLNGLDRKILLLLNTADDTASGEAVPSTALVAG